MCASRLPSTGRGCACTLPLACQRVIEHLNRRVWRSHPRRRRSRESAGRTQRPKAHTRPSEPDATWTLSDLRCPRSHICISCLRKIAYRLSRVAGVRVSTHPSTRFQVLLGRLPSSTFSRLRPPSRDMAHLRNLCACMVRAWIGHGKVVLWSTVGLGCGAHITFFPPLMLCSRVSLQPNSVCAQCTAWRPTNL